MTKTTARRDAEAIDVVERRAHGRAASARLERKNVTNDSHRVIAAFARRHVELGRVGKQQEPDFVLILRGGKCEHTRKLRCDFALAVLAGSEVARRADIDRDEDGELSLLKRELFHVRRAFARGHVPIDGAHFVAGHVLAHFVEVHTLPTLNTEP